MRILVVEDERDLNRIIVKRLTAAGYTADACFDGAEALDYLAGRRSTTPAIFDVMMPRHGRLYGPCVVCAREAT